MSRVTKFGDDMNKITIMSYDISYARLLQIVLEEKNYSVVISQNPIGSQTVIYDIDSMGERSLPEKCQIIAFSSDEKNISDKTKSKCKLVLHRPFAINDLLRAVSEPSSDNSTLTFNSINTNRHEFVLRKEESDILYNGLSVKLTANEYKIFEHLLENRFRTVTRNELSDIIGDSGNGNMIDVYICYLRKKLTKLVDTNFICSVRGKGYKIKNRRNDGF
jgi:DNA-binding winged helix-turn-helix (wHTH) protein